MAFNELTGQWEDVEVINRDLSQNTVRVETNHFSNYTFASYIKKLAKLMVNSPVGLASLLYTMTMEGVIRNLEHLYQMLG